MAGQSDEIVVRYRADTSDLDKDLKRAEGEFRSVESASVKASNTTSAGLKKVSKEADNTKKVVSSLGDKLSEISNNLPFANQAKQVIEFTKSVGGIASGASKASGAMNILKIAIASTGIGFLIAAIAGLIAYFKRTDEGATKLDGIFRALGAVVDVLSTGLIRLGKFIFSAFEDPQQAIQDFGTFLWNQVAVRFQALIKIVQATGKALTGEFTEAQKLATSAGLDLLTGVEGTAEALKNITEEAKDAAKAAYELAFAYDALEEAERNFSIEGAQTEKQINRLIIASKNRTKTDQERIAIIDQASQLEQANLKKALDLAVQRLNLIKRENAEKAGLFTREQVRSKTIIKLDEELINSQTKKLQLTKQQGQLSDEALDNEAAQIKKIIELQGASDALQEKLSNRKEVLQEELFQKNLKAIEENAKSEEQIEKEQLEAGIVNELKYAQNVLLIRRNTLNQQRDLLIANGRDINEVNRAISDNYIQYAELEKKTREQIEKDKFAAIDEAYKETLLVIKQAELNNTLTVEDAKEVQLNAEIDALNQKKAILQQDSKNTIDIELQTADKLLELKKINDDKLKKADEKKKADDLKAEQAYQNGLHALRDAGFQAATTLIEGYAANRAAIRAQDLNDSINKISAETDQRLAFLQKQKDDGLLSETNFNNQKNKIQAQQQQKEAQVKRDAFQKDKNANLIRIAIETAVAVAKTFATAGYPAGIPLAIAAAIAGAAQAAVVASQPTPKFKDGVIDLRGPGTSTSDSINAKLSRGESVMTAEETKRYRTDLQAMRDNQYDKHIYNNRVVPILEEMDRKRIAKGRERVSRTNDILQSINNNASDLSHLERLTKANNKVKSVILNVDELADAVSRKSKGSYVQ